jgi:hypothetical protein
LRKSIQALADAEGYSIEQFVASAAAEKMAAIRTVAQLRQDVAGAKREDFDRFLAAVPDVEPDPGDRMPN